MNEQGFDYTIEAPETAASVTTFTPPKQSTPYRNKTGRVVFGFTSDPSPELELLYSGASVVLRDYLRNLKELRTAIFSLKKQG